MRSDCQFSIHPIPSGNNMPIANRGFFPLLLIAIVSQVTFADDLLKFGDSPIGYVTVSPSDARKEGFTPTPRPWFCSRAVGDVAIPNDGLLGLELIGSKIADASALRSLHLPQRTSILTVSEASLSKEHLEELGKLSELTEIAFERCKFSENAFDSFPKFPQLKSCTVTFEDFSLEIEQSFVRWVSQQEKLEELVVIPQISSDGISMLARLPNLKSLHAILDANAAATLTTLKQLPRLEHLNVVASQDCPPASLDLVGQLDTLRSYRQVRGVVSRDAITKLGQSGRLEHLDLALVKIEPESLNAIATIKSLKSLDLLTDDASEDVLSGLSNVCRELPQLTSWPKLKKVSRDDLKVILSRPEIERLSINRIDSTLQADDLGELAKLKNLREINIESVRVDDTWLEKISVLPRLEYLNLFQTHVGGRGFAAFAGHESFKKLRIFVGRVDDAEIDLDFTGLCRTNLEELAIDGRFGMKSLKCIGGIRSLRELCLFGDLAGFSDDTIAFELSRLPQLRLLYMTGNCFISDVGAHELSKISTLQSLMVSGFLTDDGVSELSGMPSLKRLDVSSSKVDSAFTQNIPETHIRKFEGNVDEGGVLPVRDLEVGADGLSRIKGEQEIARIRQLEGQAPPIVTVTEFGSGATFSLENHKGKVVLIDFWGTWCQPCRLMMPKLKALYEKYQSAGLEIVSIHTSNGSENLPDYLAKKELPWIHLVDREDSTVKTFFVPHYPSLYLLDRSGKVRVALAHPQKIEETVKKLLCEGQ